MKHTKTMFDVTKEMFEDMDDEIIFLIITADETFDTNSSLIVYTTCVNRIKYEGSTMSSNDITAIKAEINKLQQNLNNEVRKQGDTLLQASISSYYGAPKVTADFFSEEWERQMDVQNRHIDMVEKGIIPAGIRIHLSTVSGLKRSIDFTDELLSEISAFEDFVEEQYLRPLQKLKAKLYNTGQIVSAKTKLSKL